MFEDLMVDLPKLKEIVMHMITLFGKMGVIEKEAEMAFLATINK